MSWHDNKRSDGLYVGLTAEAKWMVLSPDSRPPVTVCPCCKREMATAEAARRVADAVYPLAE